MDPATNSTPNFSTAKEYVEFLCHGEGGMLGYTKRLSARGFDSGGQTNPHPEECVVKLQAKVLTYEQDIQQLREQCEELHTETQIMSTVAAHNLDERLQLENNVKTLETTCSDLRVLLAQSDLSSTESSQRQERVEALDAELVRCGDAYLRLEEKMKFMVETPLDL
jgi:predicted RNase H-like nuclease (RuvC/YqgF family)